MSAAIRGDAYYLGLNSLELLDINGKTISVTASNSTIVANPESINDLPEFVNEPRKPRDTRMPRNLFSKPSEGAECGNTWLTPLAQSVPPYNQFNSLDVIFDEVVTIGGLRVWNYSKDPSRGAQQIEIRVDGSLIYVGVLRKAPKNIIESDGKVKDFSQTLLFTNNESLVNRCAKAVEYCGDSEQAVLFIDETKVLKNSAMKVEESKSGHTFGISIDVNKRPTTTMGGRK